AIAAPAFACANGLDGRDGPRVTGRHAVCIGRYSQKLQDLAACVAGTCSSLILRRTLVLSECVLVAERSAKSYKVLVGLEIHVQLATRSKMFTAAPNGASNFGAEPNSLVDEVVMGLPGVLPVMNKRAVEYSIMVGLALGCEIARHTKWDRKSYYYPDLPKNYQISQYDLPLCGPGTFEIAGEGAAPKKIRIRRAHLEEDAGKLMHEAPGGFAIDHS